MGHICLSHALTEPAPASLGRIGLAHLVTAPAPAHVGRPLDALTALPPMPIPAPVSVTTQDRRNLTTTPPGIRGQIFAFVPMTS